MQHIWMNAKHDVMDCILQLVTYAYVIIMLWRTFSIFGVVKHLLNITWKQINIILHKFQVTHRKLIYAIFFMLLKKFIRENIAQIALNFTDSRK